MKFTCYDYIYNGTTDQINKVDLQEYDLNYDIKTVADVYSHLDELSFVDAIAIQKKLKANNLIMVELDNYIIEKAQKIKEEYKAVQAWEEELLYMSELDGLRG